MVSQFTRKRWCRSITLAVAGVFAVATQAQQASAEVEADERLQVTASTKSVARTTPAALSQLSQQQQAPGLRIDAAELLTGLAGVQTDSRANYAQDTRITLRGFGARSAFGVRGVLLLLDGIPLSMPDGQAQTSSIFLDEAENVQVIRGPLATLYGNAAGGVIDWRSRSPDQSQLQIDLLGGANDTARGVLQGDWVGAEQALRLVAARLTTAGPRPHNSAERDQFALRWYRSLGAGRELIVRLDDNNAPLLQDPGSLTPAAWIADPEQTFAGASTFNTRKRIRHKQGSVTLRDDDAQRPWHISLWQGSRDIEQYLAFTGAAPTSSGGVIDLQRDFKGIDAALNTSFAYPHPLQATFGVTVSEQRDRRYGYVNNFGERDELRRDEQGDVTNKAAYSLWQWQPHAAWQIIAGLRYSQLDFQVTDYYINAVSPDDSGSRSNQAWSWNIGANYQISPNTHVFLARGRGFETPTLTELAYSAQGSGLNQQLGPAYNQQWETGVKWAYDSWRAQLSLFHITSNDEIVVDQNIDGRTIYINAEQTQRRGVEFEQQWQLLEQLDVRLAASYIDARYRNGRRLPGVAQKTLFSQFNWHAEQFSIPTKISLIGDYRGVIAVDDDNIVIAPSHFLWHLAVSQQWQWADTELAPWLKIHNLGDRDYVGSVVVNQGSGRAYEPGVGRELQLGVRITQRW